IIALCSVSVNTLTLYVVHSTKISQEGYSGDMEPQTQTTSSFSAPTPQPQKTGKNKTVLWVAIVVVVAAVTAAGVYFWQQTQVDSLNRDKNTLTMQANQAKANAQVDAKIFTASKVPFTFNYPENWALASATPILSGGDLPES